MSDLISRLSELRSQYNCFDETERDAYHTLSEAIEALQEQIAEPCTESQRESAKDIIRCKDCKYFEYNHPYIIQGIPLLGHLVCTKWGDGCRTDENGFCFMAERQTDEADYRKE